MFKMNKILLWSGSSGLLTLSFLIIQKSPGPHRVYMMGNHCIYQEACLTFFFKNKQTKTNLLIK